MSELKASDIIASFAAIKGGTTGEKTSVFLKGGQLTQLIDGLSYSVEGPKNPDVMTNNELLNGIATVEAFFVALVPGKYMFNIKFNGEHINGSPFKINVIGEELSAKKFISEVEVLGAACEWGIVMIPNEFMVDTRSVKPPIGDLKVHVKGAEHTAIHLDLKDNKNGTYVITYKPIAPGLYRMDIKIADEDIPGSPFFINAIQSLRRNSIRAQM